MARNARIVQLDRLPVGETDLGLVDDRRRLKLGYIVFSDRPAESSVAMPLTA